MFLLFQRKMQIIDNFLDIFRRALLDGASLKPFSKCSFLQKDFAKNDNTTKCCCLAEKDKYTSSYRNIGRYISLMTGPQYVVSYSPNRIF